MPESKSYSGIDRSELNNLRLDLKKEGIEIPAGDDVEVKGPFGVRLQAVYTENDQTLTITISKKPFYIPESEVWKIVDTGTAPYVGN